MKRSPLIILFITVVIDLLGFGIVLPLMPLYVGQFTATPVVAGWLTTSFSVMQFLFSPIWGRASDLYGRRPLILMSLLGSSAAFFLFGIAGSLWLLFAARIGAGILTAASLPTSYAYIADVTTPERRSRGMAMIGIAFGTGFALGPWIGAFLSKYGLSVPAFFVSGMALCNFVWSYFALPETHITDRDAAHARKVEFLDVSRFRRAFSDITLGELLTVFAVASFAFALLESTFTWLILVRFLHVRLGAFQLPPDLQRLASPIVESVFGIIGATIMVVQGAMMGGLGQRFGETRLVRIGIFLVAAAVVGIGVVGQIGWLKVLGALVAVGNGILNPSLSSLISKAAGPQERGAVLGVQQGLASLGRVIAPPLGTWLLQTFSSGTPYFLSGGLLGVAFLLSLGLKDLSGAAPPDSPSIGH